MRNETSLVEQVKVMRNETDLLARDLVRLLTDMISLHDEVLMHMRAQFEAIKQADADKIQSITARLMMLAERVAEREGLRRQITARVLAGLGHEATGAINVGATGVSNATDGSGQPITLSQLAELLAEPRRSQLLGVATGLREKLFEIDRMRTMQSVISHEMLKHLGEVLKVMCAGVQSEVYGRTGQQVGAGASTVFEAIG